MKWIRTAIASGFLLSLATLAHAEIKIVTFKKIQQDLYQTSDGMHIQTHNCYVDANEGGAVLTYAKYECHNNLRFDPKTSCEVVNVY